MTTLFVRVHAGGNRVIYFVVFVLDPRQQCDHVMVFADSGPIGQIVVFPCKPPLSFRALRRRL